jgi:hypothetical protein
MHRRCSQLWSRAAGTTVRVTDYAGPCRRFARNRATRSLTPPHDPPSAAHLTCAVVWAREALHGVVNPPRIDGMQGVRGFKSPQLHHHNTAGQRLAQCGRDGGVPAGDHVLVAQRGGRGGMPPIRPDRAGPTRPELSPYPAGRRRAAAHHRPDRRQRAHRTRLRAQQPARSPRQPATARCPGPRPLAGRSAPLGPRCSILESTRWPKLAAP